MFDKAIGGAPAGLNPLTPGPEDLEIEVILPQEDGDGPDEDTEAEPEFDANLAEHMDAGELTGLASELEAEIMNDLNARSTWERMQAEGVKLLGLQMEDRTEPWDGACGVFHPMITEAVVRFQSEAIMEMFPAKGPVKTKIIGKETPDKVDAAQRVETDMNHELTDVMLEFRAEQERMLWSLPATGCAFKKVYYDPSLGRQTSVFVTAEDIILPYGATAANTSYRVTHRMRKTENDLIKLQVAGFYRDVELPSPSVNSTDTIQDKKDKETGVSPINDDRYEVYECHVDLDLPGFEDVDADGTPTGIALPYVVTMIRGTSCVLGVRRNWLEEDDTRQKRQHIVQYDYVPGFGAYGFGLFHLIGGYAKSATSILRQLVDAGSLSNLPGGYKTKGMRIKGDDTPIAPGEFRDVDIGSGPLRDNIMPLPYKEPSATLTLLLDKIVEDGRRFSATADMKVADMSAQAPVGTTLALLERQLKVLSAVQARMHASFKQELKLLAGIMADYTDDAYTYDPETGGRQARKSDYSQVDIIPVSDPNAATMSQRVVQYQAVVQLAQMAPDIYDLPQLHRQMLDVLGVKNAEKLVPLPEDMTPHDPVSENMAVLNGKPVKAFMYQDHKSHIAVHMAAMQDPQIAAAMGQNPKAQMIMAAAQAHITEHLAFEYRARIEAALGAPLPSPEEKIPEEMEVQLSQLVAQAAGQVLGRSQQEAQAQQAAQQAQDPLMMLEQAKLKIQEGELERKKAKDLVDAAAKEDKLRLDEKKLVGELELKGVQTGAQIAKDKAEFAKPAPKPAAPTNKKKKASEA